MGTVAARARVIEFGAFRRSSNTRSLVKQQRPCFAAADPVPAVPCSSSERCILPTLQVYKDRICACKNTACSDSTDAEFVDWNARMAKASGRAIDATPDPYMNHKSMDVTSEIITCRLDVQKP